MADSLFFPKKHNYGQLTLSTTPEHEPTTHSQTPKDAPPVIWTPGFMVIFGLIVVVGVAAASVITQGWTNAYYPLGPVLILYHIPVLIGWVVLFKRTQSFWLKCSALLGVLWIVLSCSYYWATFNSLDQSSTLTLHLQAAAGLAFAGTYLCLSLAYIPENRWDAWFFRLAPVVLILTLGITLYIRLYIGTLLGNIEISLYSEALYFSLFTLWLRPACWRYQTGPTFLFGLFPFIAIIGMLVTPSTLAQRFFFTQVAFLAMSLAILHLIRQEALHIPAYRQRTAQDTLPNPSLASRARSAMPPEDC